MSQAIYIEVCIPYGSTAGDYSGTATMTSDGEDPIQIPVKLEVWDIDLPLLNDSKAFVSSPPEIPKIGPQLTYN